MNKRSQLFLIEVIVALSVLIILISSLFAAQNFPAPSKVDNSKSLDVLKSVTQELQSSGLLAKYEEAAKQQYLNGSFLKDTNATEQQLVTAIYAGLLPNTEFSVKLFYDTNGQGNFQLIDIANQDVPQIAVQQTTSFEYYSPGYYSSVYGPSFDAFKFVITSWVV